MLLFRNETESGDDNAMKGDNHGRNSIQDTINSISNLLLIPEATVCPPFKPTVIHIISISGLTKYVEEVSVGGKVVYDVTRLLQQL